MITSAETESKGPTVYSRIEPGKAASGCFPLRNTATKRHHVAPPEKPPLGDGEEIRWSANQSLPRCSGRSKQASGLDKHACPTFD
ncbi:MAG: hypothetical protein CBB71_12730 [Rhodopirellula sp. TMED11]|nr:MAG: hypothetical protein CBB71_12730 [Rhodopirellula sp. TMED11]